MGFFFSFCKLDLDTVEDQKEMEENGNPSRVKIEGRRRLCKASSKDTSHTDHSVPQFSSITDFDSSPGTLSISLLSRPPFVCFYACGDVYAKLIYK